MDNKKIFRQEQPSLPITETSDFYNACAVNDVPRIKSHLSRMTLSEINRIEPNGNTALHVACFYRNAGVVYLLLRHGAIGSIKNRYGLTPYEETTSPFIKQLLSNTGNASCIEWTFVDPPTREIKQIFDSALENTFHNVGLPFILDYLLNHYARRHIAEASPMFKQRIEQYFIDARASLSLVPLITAYTASINFDKILNRHCIEVFRGLLRVNINPMNTLAISIFYLIALFNFDPILRPKYAYTGRVYRGLKMSLDYIRTYKKNELIVNRPFVSTSKKMDVANIFQGIEHRNQFRKTESLNNFLEVAVRCIYEIRRPETRAINITNISMFQQGEEEILLMPLSTFRIVDIKSNANESEFNVLLEDCDLPAERDPVAPIIRSDFAEMPNITMVVPILQPLNNPIINNLNLFSNNSADWRRRFAAAIINMSTRCVVILIIIIIILIILVILAILLPILLRSSCKNTFVLSNT